MAKLRVVEPGQPFTFYNPEEDELQRRIEEARRQGWSEDEIQQSTAYEKAIMGQQKRKQQAMQALRQRSSRGDEGEEEGSKPNLLLSLIPFGEIARKVVKGEKVGAGEVALEAGLSLVPFGLGKVAKGARTGLKMAQIARRAGKGGKVATEVAEEGAEVVGKSAFKRGAKNLGDKLLAQQYSPLAAREARALDATGTVSRLADFGITKPDEVERISNAITGRDGILSKVVRSAVGNAKGVDTTDIVRMADELAQEPLLVAKGLDKGFKNYISQGMRKLYGGPKGSVSPTANPSETFGFIQELEAKAADLVGKGRARVSITSEDKALANAYRQVADELKERLFTGAGADMAINKSVTPQVKQQLLNIVPGNKKWSEYVEQIANAKTVGELRSLQSPFVRGGQLVRASDEAAQSIGGSAVDLIRRNPFITSATVGAAASPLTGGLSLIPAAAAAGLETNAGKRLVAQLLRRVGSEGGLLGTSTAAKTARTVGKLEAARSPLIAAYASEGGDPVRSSVTGEPDYSQMSDEELSALLDEQGFGTDSLPADVGDVGFGDAASGLNYRSADLYNEALNLLSQGDVKGAKNLLGFAESLAEYEQSTQPKSQKLSAAQQKQLMGVSAATQLVDVLEQDLKELPTGRISGGIAKLQGKVGLNDAVSAYEANRPSLALMIIKAVQGSAGQISDKDRQAIESSIPSASDTSGERDRKLKRLRSIITAYQSSATSVAPAYGGLPEDINDVSFEEAY